MAGHVHASLMAEYAEVAKTNDKPWEEFEFKSKVSGEWVKIPEFYSFDSGFEYRRKPRTININGFEVPEPLRVAPEVGETYFSVAMRSASAYEYMWLGDDTDLKEFKLGMVHKTREAAELHAKALLTYSTTVKE